MKICVYLLSSETSAKIGRFHAVYILLFGILIFSSSLFSQIVLAQSSIETATDHLLTDAELPYKYWGNRFSQKFHRPSCPFALCMNKRHLVLFHFRKEAIEAHFAPCKYCLPPVWCNVHGVILLPAKDGSSEHIEGIGIDENKSAKHQ